MAKRDKQRRSISAKRRKEIFGRDKYICGYCGERKKPPVLVIDHIIPIRYGGSHNEDNWVTACRSCNQKKWLHAPREKEAPRLIYFAGRKVAKVSWLAKGKNFPKRSPQISFKLKK